MVGRPVDENWAMARQKGYFNKTMANLALAFRWSLIAPLLGAWGLASCASTKQEGQPSKASSDLPVSGAYERLTSAEARVITPLADSATRMYPLTMASKIYASADLSSESIGYLRVGNSVARSAEPVSLSGCPGGWFAVRPVGFVCAGEHASTSSEHPVVKAMEGNAPNRELPLPYTYAFVRAVAPNYLRVPSKAEQFEKEMSLERHLGSYARLHENWNSVQAGANQVYQLMNREATTTQNDSSAKASNTTSPLDPSLLAKPSELHEAKVEEEILPSVSERFGGDGSDKIPGWLEGNRRGIPNLSTFMATNDQAVMAGRIKRHAGVALIDSFLVSEGKHERRFAMSTDARLIPADKLKPDGASKFHGASLQEVGLPVAFTRIDNAYSYEVSGSSLKKLNRLGFREMIPLTGNVRMFAKTRLVETRSGEWLRSDDLKTIAKPSKLPWYAHHSNRWIDISILNQSLVLWEGETPIYATLISTGRDGLGDPKTTHSTPLGNFRIYQKHVTTTMDSTVADSEFELRDVPWVMYFQGGYAIHTAYWHDDFGRPRSHGCINLSPIDAKRVFEWSTPDVPSGWHGSNAGDIFGTGTLIHIDR